MINSLASIATLMFSTLLMMAGFGLMGFMLPIRSISEGWSTFTISVIATGYTFGFTVSCVVTPIFVRRVGHVRVFGALITLLTVSILLCALVVEWWAWMIFRGLSGFAIAGAYLLIESWLNERVNNANRGALFSVYMVTCLVGSIGGQYIVPLGNPDGPELFMVCALIFSLALFPVALSTAQSPTPIAEAKFDLKRLYRRSPLAFFGSLLSGALSGTWGSLGGVYSQNIGMNTTEGATLLAALLAGGAISQVPIGRLSDRIDRRLVMIGAGVFGVLACLMMTMFDADNAIAVYIAGFFIGTVLYPVYSLNVAHANDLAEPDEYVTLSSAIMILYGLGTVTGPVMAGSLMQWLGPGALIWFLATAFALYASYAGWRISRRPDSGNQADKTDFLAVALPMQGTDVTGSPNTPDPDERPR
ncbi:major facilitator superfamily MFS_1 [Rhizobium sp. PDO1-076]|uniref:MFS transporter n=1 Tax=Rhizobium sp. PDO1-076 TaxID=1125979 RepID=UPI00024E2B5C|nr:MFS transporter [Rhizobium sp. PDO1-076]EHS51017.1 major facilitator superfamily MFS_1 [Rhizobium sp. PDO1-076]